MGNAAAKGRETEGEDAQEKQVREAHEAFERGQVRKAVAIAQATRWHTFHYLAYYYPEPNTPVEVTVLVLTSPKQGVDKDELAQMDIACEVWHSADHYRLREPPQFSWQNAGSFSVGFWRDFHMPSTPPDWLLSDGQYHVIWRSAGEVLATDDFFLKWRRVLIP